MHDMILKNLFSEKVGKMAGSPKKRDCPLVLQVCSGIQLKEGAITLDESESESSSGQPLSAELAKDKLNRG